ncbi:extracellular protease [Moniliophthora roreri MCA 2997]|uniref:Extracellular protease n=2 Tax=Moniliophthora roreri TaxID=221103 RepID=V2XER7_MONRO|nr:extracellular protease [Moniliophthora roreri MCA 2997]KAI3615982.1 extracellular protease [Moniliophthora roreri]
MLSSSIRSLLPLAVALLSATAIAAEPSLSLRVSGPQDVDGVHNLKVVATLTNTGNDSIKLLNDPRSLLSKAPANTFNIKNEKGDSPSFHGLRMKYSPIWSMNNGAASGTFTVLEPGQPVEVEHDLSSAYDFTHAGEGSYDITAAKSFHYLDESTQKLKVIEAKVERGFKSKVSGKLVKARATRPVRRSPGGIEYSNCSEKQQSQILNATIAAQAYTNSSYEYLSKQNETGTPRYETWFGNFTQQRHDNVTTHYANLLKHPYTNYTYECRPDDCSSNTTFAYVYPTEFGTINLCNAFWQTNTTGADSRAGTLVHEALHFQIIAGTGDHAYTRGPAMELAAESPELAIDNSDSHEYFSENVEELD